MGPKNTSFLTISYNYVEIFMESTRAMKVAGLENVDLHLTGMAFMESFLD